MSTSVNVLFTALEFDKNLPLLDLHSVDVHDVERALINFLSDASKYHSQAVQIIYGKGSGLLRAKTIDFLNQNMTEKEPVFRLVKAWKEAELVSPGGRCLVLLEVD